MLAVHVPPGVPLQPPDVLAGGGTPLQLDGLSSDLLALVCWLLRSGVRGESGQGKSLDGLLVSLLRMVFLSIFRANQYT